MLCHTQNANRERFYGYTQPPCTTPYAEKEERDSMAMIEPLQKHHIQKRKERFYGYARPPPGMPYEERKERFYGYAQPPCTMPYTTATERRKQEKDCTAAWDPLWKCHIENSSEG